jgi:hypothetical protein
MRMHCIDRVVLKIAEHLPYLAFELTIPKRPTDRHETSRGTRGIYGFVFSSIHNQRFPVLTRPGKLSQSWLRLEAALKSVLDNYI